MFDFCPRAVSTPPNKKWIFVGSVFNVKWGNAVKSFDCDIYAKKVWLVSLLFVFFPALLFLFFQLFISFVFEGFNEAENTVV